MKCCIVGMFGNNNFTLEGAHPGWYINKIQGKHPEAITTEKREQLRQPRKLNMSKFLENDSRIP